VFAHPLAEYFAVGKIGKDQVSSHAYNTHIHNYILYSLAKLTLQVAKLTLQVAKLTLQDSATVVTHACTDRCSELDVGCTTVACQSFVAVLCSCSRYELGTNHAVATVLLLIVIVYVL
jgi:hypothetical protein